jgi:hypothetical protein
MNVSFMLFLTNLNGQDCTHEIIKLTTKKHRKNNYRKPSLQTGRAAAEMINGRRRAR